MNRQFTPLVSILLPALSVSVGWLGASRLGASIRPESSEVRDLLQVRRLELVDDRGQKLAILGSDADGAGLVLLAPDGFPLVRLGAAPKSPVAAGELSGIVQTFYAGTPGAEHPRGPILSAALGPDASGQYGVLIGYPDGTEMATLGGNAQGACVLGLKSRDGKSQVQASSDLDGHEHAYVGVATAETVVARMGANARGDGYVQAMDRRGTPVWGSDVP